MGYIFFNSYGEGCPSEEYEGVLRGDWDWGNGRGSRGNEEEERAGREKARASRLKGCARAGCVNTWAITNYLKILGEELR